jgi:hypothetical protein
MTQAEFWEHIEQSRCTPPREHATRLAARLAKLRPADILAFHHQWEGFRERAHFWSLWGAAYLINSGASDDGFDYFRMWLILHGEDVYTKAVEDPDSLAEVVTPNDGYAECECYPAMRAYIAATGIENEPEKYEAFWAAYRAHFPGRLPTTEMGRRWDFDNLELIRKKFPRLAALYLARDGNNNYE